MKKLTKLRIPNPVTVLVWIGNATITAVLLLCAFWPVIVFFIALHFAFKYW